MKRSIILFTILSLGLTVVSCDSFLDTMPDNRAEVNSAAKITSLLVSAYPDHSATLLTEFGTDNVMDNGSDYSVTYEEQEDAYLWKETNSTRYDSPKEVWDAHYLAIASANQALAAIEELGSPTSSNPQKAEALLARAYNHFVLTNVFCMHYNPQTADKDMGIPFSEKPETTVSVKYERGSVANIYDKINKDIEAALPLINDEIYSVPKYHFNKKAAYAFAARFNLYYLQYDKVIKYATTALGSNPQSLVRNMTNYLTYGADDISNNYVSARETANFLIMPAYSLAGRILASGKRYAHNKTKTSNETFWALGPWGTSGSSGYLISQLYGNNEVVRFPKLDEFWEYTDKTGGTGYPHIVAVPFTADETLLCRAEAYTMEKKYDEATTDLNIWQTAHCKVGVPSLTRERINAFFSNLVESPIETTAPQTIKKKLNPLGFTVEAGEQDNFIQCVLHFRRIETIHEGLRWFDIKRYGIEIAHNRDEMSDDKLTLNDPRRAIQLPQDVISAGLTANPR